MKIGIALGSGTARGFAHVGVLKAFEEVGVKPYAISGSSMGALIGGVYASGYPLLKIEEFVRSMNFSIFRRLLDFKLSMKGLVNGSKIEEFLCSVIVSKKIENLDTIFCCVSTDLLTGREVVFSRGSLVNAIRASISFPGVFVPVYHEGMYLIDGGVRNPVPVDLLPDECDVKVAVDVGPSIVKGKLMDKYFKNHIHQGKKTLNDAFMKLIKNIFNQEESSNDIEYPNILETLVQSAAIMQDTIYKSKVSNIKNLVEIKPKCDKYKLTDFSKAGELVDLGYDATIKVLKEMNIGK